MPVETSQIDFWFDLLAKARRGASAKDGPDFSGGSMVLSLLHAFCFRHNQPVTSNQNLIALKLILSPASEELEEVHVLEPGRLAPIPQSNSDAGSPGAAPAAAGGGRGSPDKVGGERRMSLDSSAARKGSPSREEIEKRLLDTSSGGGKRADRRGSACAVMVSSPASRSAAMEVFKPDAEPPAAQLAGAVGFLKATKSASHMSPMRILDQQQVLNAKESDKSSDVRPDEMRHKVLDHPALLCVVQRRSESQGGSPMRMSTSAPMKRSEKAGTSLCLSPFDPKGTKWTPLTKINENPGALDYYIKELKLLGGLCDGYNGMALHTIRSLYPFELCMEMLADSQLPNELRAAMCVLTRQLYIESPARRARVKDANATSVWNWDALLDGPKSSATPQDTCCLSVPPAVVRPIGQPAPTAATGSAKGKQKSRDEVAECPLTAQQMVKLQEFVSSFILRSSVTSLHSKVDLVLLTGVLDICLSLFRYGHMNDQANVQELFERLVAALGVNLMHSRDENDETSMREFKLGLDAKKLICNLLEAMLDFRLRMRVGGVLRSVAAANVGIKVGPNAKPAKTSAPAQTPAQPVSPMALPACTPAGRRASAPTLSPTAQTGGAAHGLFGMSAGLITAEATPNGGWQRLTDEEAPAPSPAGAPAGGSPEATPTGGEGGALVLSPTPMLMSPPPPQTPEEMKIHEVIEAELINFREASTPFSLKKALRAEDEVSVSDEEPEDHPEEEEENSDDEGSRSVNIFKELHKGAEILAWSRTSDDMIRNLVRTASEARGSKPDLVGDALRVLFSQFNQARRLSTALASVVVVKHAVARRASGFYDEVDPLAGAVDSHASPKVAAATVNRAPDQGKQLADGCTIARTVRILERVVMGLKALASTDPLPAAGSMLSNLTRSLSKLRGLCQTHHQRRLQCALGAHEAVIHAIRVLQQVEAEGNQQLMVDGVYRLPPTELHEAREEAFDFLATFCGGPSTHQPLDEDSGAATTRRRGPPQPVSRGHLLAPAQQFWRRDSDGRQPKTDQPEPACGGSSERARRAAPSRESGGALPVLWADHRSHGARKKGDNVRAARVGDERDQLRCV